LGLVFSSVSLLVVLVASLLVLACVTSRGSWDVLALEARYPALRSLPDHRLGEALPYFVPGDGGVALILCRWSTVAPVTVSVPIDASRSERQLVRKALAAWESARLGVEFEEVPATRRAEIEIEFLDAASGAPVPSGVGDTVADCAVSGSPAAAVSGDRITAELRYASVHLRRSLPDSLGRTRPLSDRELLGALLHELGHALGYSGHTAVAGSIMGLQPEQVSRAGGRVLAGQPFEDATLEGVYAVPSGVRVGWLAVRPSGLEPILELSRVARGAGWRGPFARVGDRSASIVWRGRGGSEAWMQVGSWGQILENPQEFAASPNAAARALLAALRTRSQ
jgi:hypothetical protein